MRLRPDWNFEKMGIGGLDTEFSDIFRRAFASRVFDASFVQKMGIKHVKGQFLPFPLNSPISSIILTADGGVRNIALWSPRNWKNVDGPSDWQDVEC